MSKYLTSSISASTTQMLPGRDSNEPWSPPVCPRSAGEIDEQNVTLFWEVDLLGTVINHGTTPSILVLKDLLAAAVFELLKAGLWICLTCALQPTKPHKIPKSRNQTKEITKVDYPTKPDLLQHINRKHFLALVGENYHYKEEESIHVCNKRYGMTTDLTAHSKVCADECKSKTLDKSTHQELKHIAEEFRRASLNAKTSMDFAERTLPVLFDEVDGAPLKRYDLSDGTNNLKLRPRINSSTESPTRVADGGLTSVLSVPCMGSNLEQALWDAFLALRNNGPLGNRRALEMSEQMRMSCSGIQQPGPSSEHTQPLNTKEQINLASNRKDAASSSQAALDETTPLTPAPPAFANPPTLATTAQPHTAPPSSDGAHYDFTGTHGFIAGVQDAEFPEEWLSTIFAEAECMGVIPIRESQCSVGTESEFSDYTLYPFLEYGAASRLDSTGDTTMPDAP